MFLKWKRVLVRAQMAVVSQDMVAQVNVGLVGRCWSGVAGHLQLLDGCAVYLWWGWVWGWVDGVCPPTKSMGNHGDGSRMWGEQSPRAFGSQRSGSFSRPHVGWSHGNRVKVTQSCLLPQSLIVGKSSWEQHLGLPQWLLRPASRVASISGYL